MKETMRILALESSCDETAAAVVEKSESGFSVLSSIVASQIETHKVYGGVVPEIASRAHIEAISSVTYEAMERAGVALSDIDLVAVTAQPGSLRWEQSWNWHFPRNSPKSGKAYWRFSFSTRSI